MSNESRSLKTFTFIHRLQSSEREGVFLDINVFFLNQNYAEITVEQYNIIGIMERHTVEYK